MPEGNSDSKSRRKNIRFPPDPLAVGYIDLSINSTSDFKPTMVALVADEAMSGCGLVIKNTGVWQPGLCIRLQVGQLAPLLGTVRWLRHLDEQYIRLGIEFLE